MATVRTATPLNPQADDMRAAAAHATRGVMMTPAPAALAAPPATRHSVATTAAAGQAGAIAAAGRGHADTNPRPPSSGASTSVAVERRTLGASTGTLLPRSRLTSTGVATTPKSVVDSVSTIESATSPPAMRAHRLDAWPPLTQPRRTKPTRVGPSTPSNALIASVTRGATTKQHPRLTASARGAVRKAPASCCGVMVRPMASINSASILRND
eukprot:scaffold2191_cov138-Isochrysis_galbana.AAC.6